MKLVYSTIFTIGLQLWSNASFPQSSIDAEIIELRQQANQASKEKRWSDVEKLIRQIITSPESNASDWRNLAKLLENQNRKTEAVETWQKALQIEPNNYQNLNALCRYWITQNMPDKSRPFCESAVSVDPREAYAKVNLGHTYLLKGSNDWENKALPLYRDALLQLKSQTELEVGPIGDFNLFIQNGWQEKQSQKYKDWFTKSWSQLQDLQNAVIMEMQLSKEGKFGEAFVFAEHAYNTSKSLLGADHLYTLNRMNNLALSFRDLGQYDKALNLNEKVLAARTVKLGADHPDTLHSMNNLALSFSDLGQYNKALNLNEKVLAARTAKLGADHPDTLNSMNNLAITFSDLGQYDKALALNEKVLAARTVKLGADHPDTLHSMNNLASTYSKLGQYDKALALKEKVLDARTAKLGADHPDTLNTLSHLASAFGDLGQYDKALALKERVLDARTAKLGADHPDTLKSINNLASTYSKLGQYDKALKLNEKVLASRTARLGPDHPDTLNTLSHLASIYSLIGQYVKALAIEEKVLASRTARFGPDHLDTLDSMNNLAIFFNNLGQYDKALNLNEKVLAARTVKLGADHPDTLKSINNLASSYSKLGQYDKALTLNEKVLAASTIRLGPNHPTTLDYLSNLALNYNALGQKDISFTLLSKWEAGIEALRVSRGLSFEQKQSYFVQYTDYYKGWARELANYGLLNRAFDLADLSKARTLTDNIQMQVALRALPEEAQVQLNTLDIAAKIQFAKLESLQNSGKASASDLIKEHQSLDGITRHYQELSSQLKIKYPKYAKLIETKPSSVEKAPKLLNEGEVFISYFTSDMGKLQVFIVDNSGNVQWQDLDIICNLDKTVAATRGLFSRSGVIEGQLLELPIPEEVISDLAHKSETKIKVYNGYLWQKPGMAFPLGAKVVATTPEDAMKILKRYWQERLIEPIIPIVQGYNHWFISPDSDLALLPFDALPETENEQDNTLSSIIQKHNITLVQSFAVYALLKQREVEYGQLKRKKMLFAMGNAIYGEGWAEQRGLTRGGGEDSFRSTDPNLLDSLRASTGPEGKVNAKVELYVMRKLLWQNIPGTGREVSAVSTLFAQSDMVDSYVGGDASELKLQELNNSGSLKDYQYLLFSAHGYLAQNPALSALVLSQKDISQSVDGYITASEWPIYDIKSDLTVLSACDTGVGKTQAGEGVMGLPYALFVAGNKNTLLSLWPVDDDATAEFMRTFFAKLNAGLSQSRALAETKRAFLRSPDWSHPRYWAAFVLYGV